MPEESKFQQLKKEYPEFFKIFPAKLIEIISSEKTAEQISEICLKSGIENEETIEKIAYYISIVLLGQLPIETLPKALATNLKINTEIAEKISLETNRLIFASVKNDLAKLYRKETPSMPEKITPLPKEKSEEEKPKAPPKKDAYRELIE